MENLETSCSEKNEEFDDSILESWVVNKTFLETLSQKEMLNCPICSNLLNDPLKCETCQNRFCKQCIEKWLERNNKCPMRCPKVSFVPVDRTLKELMEIVIILCPCGAKTSLLNFPQHRTQCFTVNCFNCQEKTQVQNLKIKMAQCKEAKNNEIAGTPGKDLEEKSTFKLYIPPEVRKLIAFQLFITTKRYRGFIGSNDEYTHLYMTTYRPNGLFFSFFIYDNEKYLKVYVPRNGWYFVEPHYDRGVLISGRKPNGSINLDIFKETIISNSGRTQGVPLAVRITDFKFYFYTKSELYQPCNARCLFVDDIDTEAPSFTNSLKY